ncbi:hypothetical protein GOODEAATRI_004673 [Goodea atripinnis]|uniref:Amine oxidase domain-containing protein n=1 Tax=Goodea atripinnis TaxID=208336 RepID=A0ABV0PBE3_9TELE
MGARPRALTLYSTPNWTSFHVGSSWADVVYGNNSHKGKKSKQPCLQVEDQNGRRVTDGGGCWSGLICPGADLYLEYHVTGLYYRGGSWEVERNGGSEKFDAVILTMPVPQILQLQGDLGNCKTLTNNQKQNQSEQREQLEGVRYSSRFAIALFFSPGVVFSFTWGARYVTDSHCIRYIAVDNKKRSTGLGPSLVVHTSVPFGQENLEIEKDAIQPIILQELHRLLPDLPQPISIKSQKWRYSQVLTSVPNCPGHMTILEQPLLICGGDAFTHSNFDGCVESALSVLRAFKVSLDIQKNT